MVSNRKKFFLPTLSKGHPFRYLKRMLLLLLLRLLKLLFLLLLLLLLMFEWLMTKPFETLAAAAATGKRKRSTCYRLMLAKVTDAFTFSPQFLSLPL